MTNGNPWRTLPAAKREAIMLALLDCAAFNQDARATLLSFLPLTISQAIPESSTSAIHAINVLSTCADYTDGIAHLINAIEIIEGKSLRAQALRDTLKCYGLLNDSALERPYNHIKTVEDQNEHAALTKIRRALLVAKYQADLRKVFYTLENYIKNNPDDIDAYILRDEVQSALRAQSHLLFGFIPIPLYPSKLVYIISKLLPHMMLVGVIYLVVMSLTLLPQPVLMSNPNSTPTINSQQPISTDSQQPISTTFLDNFYIISPKWTITKQGFVAHNSNLTGNGQMVLDQQWTNYLITLRVKGTDFGINFRTAADNIRGYKYFCDVQECYWQISRCLTPNDDCVFRVSSVDRDEIGFDLQQFHELTLRVLDSDFTAELDGRLISTIADQQYSTGTVGIEGISVEGAIDTVTITPLP